MFSLLCWLCKCACLAIVKWILWDQIYIWLLNSLKSWTREKPSFSKEINTKTIFVEHWNEGFKKYLPQYSLSLFNSKNPNSDWRLWRKTFNTWSWRSWYGISYLCYNYCNNHLIFRMLCNFLTQKIFVLLLLILYKSFLPLLRFSEPDKGKRYGIIALTFSYQKDQSYRGISCFQCVCVCDQTGRFSGNSKRSWWKSFINANNWTIDASVELREKKSLSSLDILEKVEVFLF